jgi:hypothetical protein
MLANASPPGRNILMYCWLPPVQAGTGGHPTPGWASEEQAIQLNTAQPIAANLTIRQPTFGVLWLLESNISGERNESGTISLSVHLVDESCGMGVQLGQHVHRWAGGLPKSV